MTGVPLLAHALRGARRSQAAWSAGVVAVLALYLPLYRDIAGPDMTALLASLPPRLVSTLGYDQIGTGAGYVQATFFGLLGFVLLTIASVAWGSAALAGDEESGGLELVVAHGVSRRRVVLERWLALVVRLAGLGVVVVVVVLVLDGPAGLGIGVGGLLAATAALLEHSLLVVDAALAAGALTGRRVWATGAAAAVAVVGYAAHALASQSASLGWLGRLSPYSWAFDGTPLSSGADPGGLALLCGAALVLLAVAVVALERRDLGT